MRAERGSVVTDVEKLEWACEVLNREDHHGFSGWGVYQDTMVRPGSSSIILSAFEAIAIALALDEQSRRKWPEMERAQWACQTLNRQEYRGLRWTSGGYHVESVWGNAGEHLLVTLGRSVAVAIAESLIRREMLGYTSDASPNEVKS